MKSLILGTFNIDDISLPNTQLSKVVGGAASYAALASALFATTGVGGVAGNDFPKEFVSQLEEKGVDISNIQYVDSPSFRWKAMYSADLNNLKTTYQSMNASKELDVEKINGRSKTAKVVFFSNLDPNHQLKMIEKTPKHVIKLLDSMDLWIEEKRDVLKKVLKQVDIYFVSEHEASILIGKQLPLHDMITEVMRLGPRVVVIKKGRHGLSMYGELGTLAIPSYPLAHVLDPSGAGDSLGGATAGALARLGKFDFESVATALFMGSVVASFVIEGYTHDVLLNLTLDEVLNRSEFYLKQLPNTDNMLIDNI
ncbi:hypothetical protein DRJ25_05480 [Candidatus Woesearchaeota archaeon]|nr:MAG: hypothetical protein DRJ25_05480 [Candidatus Woesearchaeota archaeon]